MVMVMDQAYLGAIQYRGMQVVHFGRGPDRSLLRLQGDKEEMSVLIGCLALGRDWALIRCLPKMLGVQFA